MFPFHKLYSAIFKSFDISSETETVVRLREEDVKKIMIIKRSWIFGLAMIWIPVLIVFISVCNISISYFYYRGDEALRYALLIWVSLSLVLFIFSVWSYLSHFRVIYDIPRIETDEAKLTEWLHQGDLYFIRFFDQTILNQLIIIGLIIWSMYFYMTHLRSVWSEWIIADSILLFIQWILLWKYRKRMMDLEMDYNIVIPGKIFFVNQSGMLSSSQAVEWEKVKTVTARYPGWLSSFFQYGTIEIMTEWGESALGTTSMFYVPHPTDTAGLIQTLLSREWVEVHIPSPTENTDSLWKIPTHIGPKEVSYDVKGIVRDVLR